MTGYVPEFSHQRGSVQALMHDATTDTTKVNINFHKGGNVWAYTNQIARRTQHQRRNILTSLVPEWGRWVWGGMLRELLKVCHPAQWSLEA